jgi:hypothetical protein
MRALDLELRVQRGFQLLPCATFVADLLAEGADGHQPPAHASLAYRPSRVPRLLGQALQGPPHRLLPSRHDPLPRWSHAPLVPGGRALGLIVCHLMKGLVQPRSVGVTALRRMTLLKLLQPLVGPFQPFDKLDARHGAPLVVAPPWPAGPLAFGAIETGHVEAADHVRTPAPLTAARWTSRDGKAMATAGDNGLTTPLTGAVTGWPRRWPFGYSGCPQIERKAHHCGTLLWAGRRSVAHRETMLDSRNEEDHARAAIPVECRGEHRQTPFHRCKPALRCSSPVRAT